MIDFRFNYPVLDYQDQWLKESLQALPDNKAYLRMEPLESFPEVKQAAAQWLSRPGMPLAAESVFVTCGGHHALTAILLATGLTGGCIAVDPLTYNGFIGLATLLGIQLISCPNDEHGMEPGRLSELCQQWPIRAVYLMPTIHNPLGKVMPLERRQQLIAVADEHDLLLIDDDAYGYLASDAPTNFALLAPERSFYIYSLSKVIAPGVKTCFLLAPVRFKDKLIVAIRVTTSGSVPLYTKLVHGWLLDGTLSQLIEHKRENARHRQQLAKTLLNGIPYAAHPTSYHLWLPLPPTTDDQAFSESLKEREVDVIPSQPYSPTPVASLKGIRVALGGEPIEQVQEGLLRLAAQCNEWFHR